MRFFRFIPKVAVLGLTGAFFTPSPALANATSQVNLHGLQIRFLDAFLTDDPTFTPLTYFDDYEISSPYVNFSISDSHTATNSGTGSSSASGSEAVGGLPVDDWAQANDDFEPSSPAIVISGQTQAQAEGIGSKYSSSYASDLMLGVSSYLYDQDTNDPLGITLRFSYSLDWDMSLARDTMGQASGFVELQYALDSNVSNPNDFTSIYDAAFGAGLNFPANIDETVDPQYTGQPNGEIWISLGNVDYASLSFRTTVASYAKVESSPVPLPSGGFLLLSGIGSLLLAVRRRERSSVE